MRDRHCVHACAGAFSGIGIKNNWGTHVCEEIEQAYNADMQRTMLAASFSEYMEEACCSPLVRVEMT
jgi:hypothetical protein